MHRSLVVACLLLSSSLALADTKSYDATYTARVADIPPDTRQLKIWIPLPTDRAAQKIEDLKIVSDHQWTIASEKEWGNRYAWTVIDRPGETVETRVTFRVTRHGQTLSRPAETAASQDELKRSLRPNRLVTLSPRVYELAKSVVPNENDHVARARRIYDFILANMKYDKTTPGWGEGDTERACDVKSGNCTDFHSLFMSIARASSIPSRFMIGFPLTAADGQVTGYHCWADFHSKDRGWVTVDPSDASKYGDPKLAEFLFGNLNADRVEFARGRDLVLQPATSRPLNLFIYPHAESEDEPVGTPTIRLEFRKIDERGPVAAKAAR